MMKAEEEIRQHEKNERVRAKKEIYQQLRNQADDLVENHSSYTVDQLISNRDELVNKIQNSLLLKIEKQEIERLLRPLHDILIDKKEKALLELSDDDRQQLQKLKIVLTQRKERRAEIKVLIETLRKSASASGLDFEKAMDLNSQIHEEKDRLERANQGIEEIEEKIRELQVSI